MRGAYRAAIRSGAFVRKEAFEILRQPRLLLLLVIGPFMVLLLFGAGLRDTDPLPRTVLVVDPGSELADAVDDFARAQSERLIHDETTADLDGARARLEQGEVDLVIAFPAEVSESIRGSEQATITLYHSQMDPVEGRAIELFMQSAVDDANQQVIAETVARAQAEAGDRRGDVEDVEVGSATEELLTISPEVIAAPFRGEAIRVAADGIALQDFYAPAVAVVLLQHLLVTALGLSLVREESLGTTELYRVAPLRAGEIVVGKYLGHLLVAGVVGAALLALLIFGLDVPMRGDPAWLVATVAAVCFASAGLGFLVSLASRSDSQAVQYAMLVLLLTVFFSGFILSLDRFTPQVGWVSYLVPATYGIDALRDVMLRGAAPSLVAIGALIAMGVGFGIISWLWSRRRMRNG
jgi:ABC-2 type transport system permease protein